MNKTEIISIINAKYSSITLTPAQESKLNEWLRTVTPEEFHDTLDACNNLPETLRNQHYASPEFTRKLEALFDQQDAEEHDLAPSKKPATVLRIWRPVAVAASVIGLIFISYFFFIRTPKINAPTPIVQFSKDSGDIMPGSNRAILTLANGSKIILDSTSNGLITTQPGAQIIKTDSGKIQYANISSTPQFPPSPGRGAGGEGLAINTLSTPRGGQYQLTLPDGTRVWLNAASSITYPTAFNTSERKVTISGEAYFEVVHNANQPFVVKVNNAEIRDIGTSFNINAYPDEPVSITTVVSGIVEIKNTRLSANQAAIWNTTEFKKLDHVDAEASIAWKNGFFTFEDLDLKIVLRQVSRWYDVDLVYQTEPTKKLSGGISRQLSLQELLKLLRQTGMQFEIKNKTLIISK